MAQKSKPLLNSQQSY